MRVLIAPLCALLFMNEWGIQLTHPCNLGWAFCPLRGCNAAPSRMRHALLAFSYAYVHTVVSAQLPGGCERVVSARLLQSCPRSMAAMPECAFYIGSCQCLSATSLPHWGRMAATGVQRDARLGTLLSLRQAGYIIIGVPAIGSSALGHPRMWRQGHVVHLWLHWCHQTAAYKCLSESLWWACKDCCTLLHNLCVATGLLLA